jgi:hypothetical protein
MNKSPPPDPSPNSRRLVLIVVALFFFIIVALYVGMNLNHYKTRNEGPPDQSGASQSAPARP